MEEYTSVRRKSAFDSSSSSKGSSARLFLMSEMFNTKLGSLFRSDPVSILFCSSLVGLFLGSYAASHSRVVSLRSIIISAISRPVGLWSQILVAELPLLIAGIFYSFWGCNASLAFIPAFSCSLTSFALCSFVLCFGAAGAVPGALILAGNFTSLVFLNWFLLCPKYRQFPGKEFVFALLGIAFSSALFSFLAQPFLSDLAGIVFNFT